MMVQSCKFEKSVVMLVDLVKSTKTSEVKPQHSHSIVGKDTFLAITSPTSSSGIIEGVSIALILRN